MRARRRSQPERRGPTPVPATVMMARMGALEWGVHSIVTFFGVGGLAGQRAQLTGGPRCDTDAASRSAERSG